MNDRCTRCLRKYKLDVRLHPVSVKSWEEDGKNVTSYKYECSCGSKWERTIAKEI